MTGLIACLALLTQDTSELTAKDLEGTWVGQRFTEGKGGKDAQGVKVIFTFKGDLLAGQKASKSLIGKARYTLFDKGRRIDATGISGGYRNKLYKGIIKVEGDTLTWCSSGTAGNSATRPTSFVANPGKAHYLIICTRQKEPERRR